MRPLGILLVGCFLLGLIAAPCTHAEDWSIWPVASSGKKSSSKKEPSFLDKISTSTKNFFTKTRGALTPGSKTTKKKPAQPWVNNNSSVKSEPKKKGLFDSWFAKEESKKPETASEWIGLPRPE